MTKMLTLFGQDLSELTYKQLERELRSQKFILLQIVGGGKRLQRMLDKRTAAEEAGTKKVTPKQITEDKLTLADIYIANLEALIREIERLMSTRIEPLSNRNGSKSRNDIRVRNAKASRESHKERQRNYTLNKQIANDPLLIAWDRDRFMLIAEDRGYQTEEVLVQDVAAELQLDIARTKILIDKGRFTWGQVLCLGAMMQMTPKEFCDTFLSGYFTEQFGEYRADYENLSRSELLKQAIKSDPLFGIKAEYIEIGADGKPIDEEVWFDD